MLSTRVYLGYENNDYNNECAQKVTVNNDNREKNTWDYLEK